MKLLLTIELSDKTKKEITDQLSDLKKTYPQFQWEPAENYSILVHSFEGSSEPKMVINKLEPALYDKEPFYLYADAVNLTIHNKITLYLNFRREKGIEKISKDIKEQFQIAQSPERYVPRLILANYKIPSKQQYFVIKKRLAKLEIDLSFKINRLSLFKENKKIHTFKLL